MVCGDQKTIREIDISVGKCCPAFLFPSKLFILVQIKSENFYQRIKNECTLKAGNFLLC